MKHLTLVIVNIFCCILMAKAQHSLRLWYNKPAAEWEACVPLGNGRLGAMPDGGIFNENITLNDITLWSGGPQDGNKEDAATYLPEIRKLLFEGKNAEADRFARETFRYKKGAGTTGKNKGPFGSFQILGNLHLKYGYEEDTSLVHPQNYIRELLLDNAVAKCRYKINGVTYMREYFTSFSDDVIVIKITADQPGKISFTLSLDRPERYKTAVHDNELDMSGQLTNGTDGNGMRYFTRVSIKPEGGKLIPGDSTLEIKSADAAIIYISSATDFRKATYKETTAALLKAAMDQPYKKELAMHIKAYQKLFGRVSLDLNNKNLKQASLPTDERLAAFTKDPSDNGLPVLYFQFGRYLLIGSARPGLLPPNLQGLWANTTFPPWYGDYHLDVNVQMNHWPVEVTNLPMLNESFYELINGLVKPGRRTAKAYFNAEGWMAFSITNIWGYTTLSDGARFTGSGWLCQLLWRHYAFTQDRAYLKKIYPIIKGAAAFYLSALVKDPANGWLVMAPSTSPENRFRLPNGEAASLCVGSTIDNQIIRHLFSHVISASELLKTDASFRKQIEKARAQLPPNQIDKDGRLMEWLEPYGETDPHHRHVSPLWGLYPGNEITPAATPALAAAAKALLVRRGDLSTGWSMAWKMNLWARMKDGNHAFKLLKYLLQPTMEKGHGAIGGVYPNLFNACPPFQIDGNFGGTAGIAEMLIQSHEGYIEFLPALPDQWPDGRFSGLCVRGGGEVGLQWKDRRVQQASLQANVSNTFHVKLPVNSKYRITINKKTVKSQLRDNIIELQIKKGETANFYFEQF